MDLPWPRYAMVALVALVMANASPLVLHGGGPPATALPAPTGPSLTPALVTPAAGPNPYSFDMAATAALGAFNFTSRVTGQPPNASTFRGGPEWAKLDAHGNLWVADYGGNRVLEFQPPFTTGEAATLVIGQANFSGDAPGTGASNLSSPAAVAFDAHGDLWISDFGEGRVFEYLPPFSTGMAASLVLGAPSFSSPVNLTPTASQLSGPADLNFDPAGTLWVADSSANRVLGFDPPFSSGMVASVVLGQSNFLSAAPSLTSTGLSFPISVVASSSMLWTADYTNHRVLGYPSPWTTGEPATVVLGQTGFTSNNATGPNSLSSPTGVASGPDGRLWVSDAGHNRVVEFPAVPTNDSTPLIALGQSSLAGTQAGVTARNLSSPAGVFVSGSSVWVTDSGSNRILEYVPASYPVDFSERGLPSGAPWYFSFDNLTLNGSTTSPEALRSVNGSYPFFVTPVPGFAANPSYETVFVDGQPLSIVVEFLPASPNPFSPGMPATVVLGQPDFWSASAASGVESYAVVFDSHGDLWAADWSGNRVLEFSPPFSNGEAPALILGQSSSAGRAPGNSATNLSHPDGLAFDAAGNLWVADYSNNRVVEFPAPFSTGEAATLVLGQTGFNLSAVGTGAAGLQGPAGIAFDGPTLWVCDYNNNRVLGYLAPRSTDESASRVLGQPGFNQTGASATATGFAFPSWIAFDARGNAWVADSGHNRALEFPAPLPTDEAAAAVLGQPNFTSDLPGLGTSFLTPEGIAVDPHGNVWVADSGNNRVLEFTGPAVVTNQTPALVLGQGSLSTGTPALGPRGLSFPALPAFDPAGNLWVCDLSNERILGYVPSEYPVTFEVAGGAAPAEWNLTVDGVTTHVVGPNVTFEALNSTLSWSVSAAGWLLPAYRGTVLVNGAASVVPLAFARDVYTLTFTETGLASGTNWSVTVDGTSQTSNSTTIAFQEPNGTFSYSVGVVSGYSVGEPAGTASLTGAPSSILVRFTGTSAGDGGGSTTFLWLGAGVLVVLVVLVALWSLVLRRRRPAFPAAAPTTTGTTPPTRGVAPAAERGPTTPPVQEARPAPEPAPATPPSGGVPPSPESGPAPPPLEGPSISTGSGPGASSPEELLSPPEPDPATPRPPSLDE